MTIKIVKSILGWREVRQDLTNKNLAIGFVPTMGALHDGHLSLVKKSVKETDKTVVSIFVNPTQFNDSSDFEKYPQTLSNDMELLSKVGVDYIFYPDYSELYPDNYRYKVTENKFSNILCGEHRSGHFDGVLSVVMKLFNIIRPDNAYFGEKDYQQYLLIKDMVDAFFMEINVVACPIIREKNGLAMSSRNRLLAPDKREKAKKLYEELNSKQSPDQIIHNLKIDGFEVDYVEEHFNRRFVATTIDNVRLIDNVEL